MVNRRNDISYNMDDDPIIEPFNEVVDEKTLKEHRLRFFLKVGLTMIFIGTVGLGIMLVMSYS